MRHFLACAMLLLVFPQLALAHVGYVTSPEEMASVGGPDWAFLLSPFTDPFSLALIIGTIIIVPILFFVIRRMPAVKRIVAHVRANTHRYMPLTPWMLRLSLGIALIGAGVSNSIITPAIPGAGWLATAQILLGFLILAGLFTAPATLAALVVYALALVRDWYGVGNFDFFTIGLAILVLGSAMPGIDDLFGIGLFPRFGHLRDYAPLILRIGMGGAMTFLAVYEKLLNPHLSALVVEKFGLTTAIPVSVELWVLAAGLIELAVGLSLLFGIVTRLTVVVAFIVLSLSFFYFGEDVYSHITLFGTLSVLFVTGGGKCSIDQWWAKKNHEKSESFTTMQRSEEVLAREWNNKADQRWNKE